MFDDFVTLAVQHYVLTAVLVISIGILLNLLIAAGPEIVESLRMHKLY